MNTGPTRNEPGQVATKTVPWPFRRWVTRYGWRHVKFVAVVRALVALWLIILGSIFCANGYWWGALLLVAAGLVGWLACQIPRWKRALDAENGRPSV